MSGFLQLFDTSDFSPLWKSGEWSDVLGWFHIIADIAIGVACGVIPLALAIFLLCHRYVPFPRIFWLLSVFILGCGINYFLEAAAFWWPAYRLDAVLKVIAAIVSWATVFAMIPLLPKAIAFPSLARMNTALERSVAYRADVERALRHKADELEKANAELERFNRLAIGREQRMIELKQEIDALLKQQGQHPRYAISAKIMEESSS